MTDMNTEMPDNDLPETGGETSRIEALEDRTWPK